MSVRFPDVPLAVGVPLVFRRDTRFVDAGIRALESDALGGVQAARVTWGIFDRAGRLALEPDNIVVVEPTREFRIADYPIEEGGFASYNKVATPAVERVTLTKGGDVAARTAFLAAVERMLESLDLFSVVTPEAAYLNRNLVRRDLRRSAETGASLLSIELEMQEVRLSAVSAFTSAADPLVAPKSPGGADPVNLGPVQPRLPDDQLLDILISEQARRNAA
jgi:hypothetical protein